MQILFLLFVMHCASERPTLRSSQTFNNFNNGAMSSSIVTRVIDGRQRGAGSTLSASSTIYERLDLDPSWDLRREADRVKSFRKWSNPAVQPSVLAKFGFFYTGRSDLVQCAFCHGRLEDWRAGDDVLAEHGKRYQECPFVLGYLAANEDRKNNVFASNSTQYSSQNGKTPPFTQVARSTTVFYPSTNVHTRSSKHDSNEELLRRLGIYSSKAKYLNMVTVQSRILTFKTWPSSKKQTPMNLAEAGFFFTGDSDRVQCFFCGGVLHDWSPAEDPWAEHAHWFKTCDFVRLCKGDAFMVESSKDKPPPQRENDENDLNLNANSIGALSIDDLDAKIPSWRGDDYVRSAFDMGYDEKIVASSIITNDFTMFETLDEMIDRIESLRPYLEKLKVDSSPTELPELPSASTYNPKPISRDVKLCKICMDAEISVVFLPCAHLVCCPNCSPAFEHCPFCRKETLARLRIFMT